MTAYGRAHLTTAWGRITAEIQSVNRKHLELNIVLPKELSRFDTHLRKLLSAAINRGQVSIKITAFFDQAMPVTVSPNLALARQLKKAWEAIAKDLNLPKESINLSLLAQEGELLRYEEAVENEENYKSALTQVVERALEEFLSMRTREGSSLQQDIVQRFGVIRNQTAQIADIAPQVTEKYRQKLSSKLQELFANLGDNEERLLREVSLFAERSDITEEITRLQSHLNQAEDLLQSTAPIGKTLEFLLQEMQREINTTGSKAADVSISRLVVDVKSELEKIREQIQNIE